MSRSSRVTSRAEFDMTGPGVALNIQDTGGSYVDDFPAMVELSLRLADAVLLGILHSIHTDAS